MRINRLHIKNFRCYENVEMDFHSKFNVLVGINGTGKTSILEALRIAIGSLFLGVDKYKDKISSPGISQDDVRLSMMEQQYPVVIEASGIVDEIENREITWERSLETKGGGTRFSNAKSMKDISIRLQESIRKNDGETNIPLIAYYSTDRFKKEKKGFGS